MAEDILRKVADLYYASGRHAQAAHQAAKWDAAGKLASHFLAHPEQELTLTPDEVRSLSYLIALEWG